MILHQRIKKEMKNDQMSRQRRGRLFIMVYPNTKYGRNRKYFHKNHSAKTVA
jgi:hypothetical protein